jgi:hypothetical protein
MSKMLQKGAESLMKRGITIALIAVASILAFIGGYVYHQPETIVQEVIVEKPVIVTETKLVEVEVERVVEVPIETVIEVTPTPLGFKDVEELQTWLDSEGPVHRAYLGGSAYTCMDYCAEMVREAALDGYLLSQEGVMRKRNGEWYAHSLCKTWVDGEWIYIEPQTREIADKDWD